MLNRYTFIIRGATCLSLSQGWSISLTLSFSLHSSSFSPLPTIFFFLVRGVKSAREKVCRGRDVGVREVENIVDFRKAKTQQAETTEGNSSPPASRAFAPKRKTICHLTIISLSYARVKKIYIFQSFFKNRLRFGNLNSITKATLSL